MFGKHYSKFPQDTKIHQRAFPFIEKPASQPCHAPLQNSSIILVSLFPFHNIKKNNVIVDVLCCGSICKGKNLMLLLDLPSMGGSTQVNLTLNDSFTYLETGNHREANTGFGFW